VYSGFLLQALAATWHYVGPERLKVIGERIGYVLVCTGDQDRMVGCEHSEVLVKGIGGGVVKRVFEGAGHALQFECVGEYNRMIEGFVTKAYEGVGAGRG
jgi:pimeloyl-ACP methyl ester carboxylesterase